MPKITKIACLMMLAGWMHGCATYSGPNETALADVRDDAIMAGGRAFMGLVKGGKDAKAITVTDVLFAGRRLVNSNWAYVVRARKDLAAIEAGKVEEVVKDAEAEPDN